MIHLLYVKHQWLLSRTSLPLSRGGRRRFGNIAGLFQVMSVAIQALDKGVVDPNYLAKLAKIATSEVISTKIDVEASTLTMLFGVGVIRDKGTILDELNADWQRAAAGVLVSIGSHMPDLVCAHFSFPYENRF